MEKKLYKTLVKNDNKFGNNPFVLGNIIGIRYVVCHKDREFDLAYGECADGDIVPVECTAEQYEEFKTLVENRYPDLCIFEYMG